MKLVFQTENEKGKKQPYKFALDPFNPSPQSNYSFTSFIPFDASPYFKQLAEEKFSINSSKIKVFDEVKIVAKKERDYRMIGNPGSDRIIDSKKTGTAYPDVFQMIQFNAPMATVKGNPPQLVIYVRGHEVVPMYMLNGMVVEADFINSIPPTSIDYMEVLGTGSSARYGVARVINVVLKPGGIQREPIGMNTTKYPGFYQAREFYSPRYDVPDNRHNLDDKRTTLHWEPVVVTDAYGRAAISFFTADAASTYRIVMEGITYDGYPGTASATFVVE
jgi:hypothetical protein